MKKIPITEMLRHTITSYKQTPKKSIIIILDNIRSMHNVGATFRVADAFLIEEIYLCGITATPPRNEISKTALGAEEHVNWKYFNKTSNAIKEAKLANYTIVAIEQIYESTRLQDFKVDSNVKYAIVFGNEVSGISNDCLEDCDFACEIPQFGVKHSLNVSVALGIICWKFSSEIE